MEVEGARSPRAGVLRQEILQRATTQDGWLSGVLDRDMVDASSLVLPEIGLLRSDDLGCSWLPWPGFPGNTPVMLAFAPDDANTFYILNSRSDASQLYRSQDQGQTFQLLYQVAQTYLSSVKLAPSAPQRFMKRSPRGSRSGWRDNGQI